MVKPYFTPKVTFVLLLSILNAASGAESNLFTIPDKDLGPSPTVIAYGDTRFTDPAEKEATNPKARRWLVDKIAAEHPKALLISGDVPWHGIDPNDYKVYREETGAWRSAHIHVYPALGNHEFHGCGDAEQQCLENWWNAFPELRGHRWYSVKLGSGTMVLNLDSNASFETGGAQSKWLEAQLHSLPGETKFVFINLHYPPMSDYQEHGDASHNVRPNEKLLAGYLAKQSPALHARLIVIGGHVHNYERFEQDGVTYLVSGGGAAKPRKIVRTKEDLYQDSSFPNYHYVRFTVHGDLLRGEMMRLADADAESPQWQVKDTFTVDAAGRR